MYLELLLITIVLMTIIYKTIYIETYSNYHQKNFMKGNFFPNCFTKKKVCYNNIEKIIGVENIIEEEGTLISRTVPKNISTETVEEEVCSYLPICNYNKKYPKYRKIMTRTGELCMTNTPVHLVGAYYCDES